jgi:hypothetical protein
MSGLSRQLLAPRVKRRPKRRGLTFEQFPDVERQTPSPDSAGDLCATTGKAVHDWTNGQGCHFQAPKPGRIADASRGMLGSKQERIMGDRWVKCLDFDNGDSIYVNLGNVLAMRRVVTGNGQYTRVYFKVGTEAKDSVSVQETPDQILNLKTL